MGPRRIEVLEPKSRAARYDLEHTSRSVPGLSERPDSRRSSPPTIWTLPREWTAGSRSAMGGSAKWAEALRQFSGLASCKGLERPARAAAGYAVGFGGGPPR